MLILTTNADIMFLVFTFYLVRIPQTNMQMANAMNLLRAKIFTSAILKFIYQFFGYLLLFLSCKIIGRTVWTRLKRHE